MNEAPARSRTRGRARTIAAALVVAAAITAAGCSSGGSKASPTTVKSSTTQAKKKSSDTGSLGSDTGSLSTSSKKKKLKSTKNLTTDMHQQANDTGSIRTTSGNTFTAGSLSFTIPSGWQQGTDDSGNPIIVNGNGAKITVLQDPDYSGGGALAELKSLEQQLSDTITVVNETQQATIAGGQATEAVSIGTINSQQGFSAIVVALATNSEGYALLATVPTSDLQTVANDIDTMVSSLQIA